MVKFLFWIWIGKSRSIVQTIVLLIFAYACGVLFGRYVHPKVSLGGPLMCFSVPMAFFLLCGGISLPLFACEDS